ncbi:hypothetical protein CRG98_006867 [Punica granatum]|uniref:Uncharacterized protein n=1 Tax=Punica granatum TaxID=22663 RepID=A0A2I0KWE4_PUNGR|nr:hypothetical protein CRG98_006867 [Punica granatum]
MELAMVRGVMLGQDQLLVSMQKMKVHVDNGRRMIHQRMVSERTKMSGAKFEVEMFDGSNDFRLWKIKMKALLV